MPRKNPAAVALGRRGGKVRSPRKATAARLNGAKGGTPTKYRLLPSGVLERRDGDRWLTLELPLDAAARAYLRRLR